MQKNRKGIACGGQWIVDRLKCIDQYPQEFSVAMIADEKFSGGGCSFNVIMNLAKFDSALPLTAVGLIGDDADGRWIVEELSQYPNISLDHLIPKEKGRTSYTDVYSASAGNSRTFFHYPGTNSLFSDKSVDIGNLNVALFHLGYLGILEGLDQSDSRYGTKSARLLSRLQKHGIKTSVDLITTDRSDFCEIVDPALQYTDYLIINEMEASRLNRIPIRVNGKIDIDALQQNAEMLLSKGVGEFVVIHFPEGALLQTQQGETVCQPSLQLPDNFIVGSTGAGDSFCAAVIYGIYQKWDFHDMMHFAVCAGAQNLRDLSSTGAMTKWQKVITLYDKFSKQKFLLE
ncbi:carbohydrate kinase family protein [bacterium]|nr:carbohydrate kinase family protein [bacterium]